MTQYDHRILTAAEYFIRIIKGKWKLRIIYILNDRHQHGFNEITRLISESNRAIINKHLIQLTSDMLIQKEHIPSVAVHNKYVISDRGLRTNEIIRRIGEQVLRESLCEK